jgi:hypothetical protein
MPPARAVLAIPTQVQQRTRGLLLQSDRRRRKERSEKGNASTCIFYRIIGIDAQILQTAAVFRAQQAMQTQEVILEEGRRRDATHHPHDNTPRDYVPDFGITLLMFLAACCGFDLCHSLYCPQDRGCGHVPTGKQGLRSLALGS